MDTVWGFRFARNAGRLFINHHLTGASSCQT
jgi:hypothetical protein